MYMSRHALHAVKSIGVGALRCAAYIHSARATEGLVRMVTESNFELKHYLTSIDRARLQAICCAVSSGIPLQAAEQCQQHLMFRSEARPA